MDAKNKAMADIALWHTRATAVPKSSKRFDKAIRKVHNAKHRLGRVLNGD